MPKTEKSQGLAGTLGVSALLLTGVLLLSVRGPLEADVQETRHFTDIGVQHDSPLTLTIRQSTGKVPSLIEVRSDDATGQTGIHVPDTWEVREVRGGSIGDIAKEPAAGGYIRWRLPPRVTLSFRVPDVPHLRIHNGSPASLLVIATRIDLVSGTTDERSVIATEKAVELW